MGSPRTGRVDPHGNRWRMQVKIGGERIRRSFDTEQQARAALAELLARVDRDYKAEYARKLRTLTVADLVASYLDSRRSELEASTLARYDNVVHKYVLPCIGAFEVKQIAATPYLLEDFLLREVPWGSARKALEVLGPVFRHAADNGLIDSNPIGRIRRPRRPSHHKKKDVPPPEHVRTMVDRAWELDDNWGLYVDSTSQLGTRRSETLALQWEDFEFPAPSAPHGWVHVCRAIGKARGTYIKLPKSGLERDLMVGREFFEMLEPYRREEGWLFPGRKVLPRANPDEFTTTSSAGRLLLWLFAHGGEVSCPSGRAGADARRAIGVNSSTLSIVTADLAGRGLLDKTCNARRTFSLGLTDDGLSVASALADGPPDEPMPMHPDTAAHKFRAMVVALGLSGPSGRPYGLHSLRHFVATHIYNRTHDWVQVAKFMGHTSPAITMELYANNVVHATQELIAKEVTRLYRPPESE